MPVPSLEIIEQPAPKTIRFRYACEGRSAGSITGANSTDARKTFPAVRVRNYVGKATIVVSCVTNTAPYQPHPNNLVGTDCQHGVMSRTVLVTTDKTEFVIEQLGIQCVRKSDVLMSLNIRRSHPHVPFEVPSGVAVASNGRSYDLHTLRLCFQLLIPDEHTGETVALPPVLSDTLYDKKANIDLTMFDVSDTTGSAAGGKKLIILCDKVIKEDIAVRFFERDPAAPPLHAAAAGGRRLDDESTMVWSARADLQSSGVHRQVAIVLRTPAYGGRNGRTIHEPVEVFMQLYRPSDGACSAPQTFVYTPAVRERSHPESATKRKRRRVQRSRELHEYVAAISESEWEDGPDDRESVVAGVASQLLGSLPPAPQLQQQQQQPPLIDVDSRMMDDLLVDLFEPAAAAAVVCEEATNDLDYVPPPASFGDRQRRMPSRIMQPNINVGNLNVMVGNAATLQAVAVQAQSIAPCGYAAPANDMLAAEQQKMLNVRSPPQQQQPMQAMIQQQQQQPHQQQQICAQQPHQHQHFHQHVQMKQPPQPQPMFNNTSNWPGMNPQHYVAQQQQQPQPQQQQQPQYLNNNVNNNCMPQSGVSDFLNYMDGMTTQNLQQQQPIIFQPQQQHHQQQHQQQQYHPSNPFNPGPMRGYYAQDQMVQQQQQQQQQQTPPQFHQHVQQQQYVYPGTADQQQQQHQHAGFQQQFQHQQLQHQPFKASAPMGSVNRGQFQMNNDLNHAMAYMRQH